METLPAERQEHAAAARVAAPPPLARAARRAGVAVLGSATVLVGLVLVPLPGPGWAIVLAGTTLLGTEFTWAARLSGGARRLVGAAGQWALRRSWATRAALAVGLVVSAVGPVVLLAF